MMISGPNLLRGLGVLVVLAGPAHAAGPEPVALEPLVTMPVEPVTDWSGPYVGLSLGAAFGATEAEVDGYEGDIITDDLTRGLFPRDVEEDGTGAVGGLSLGYNQQWGNFVGGLELGLSAMDHENEASFSEFDSVYQTDTDTTYGTELSGLATFRLRGGFVQERNLFYATAGVAAGQVENEFTLDLPGLGLDGSWSEEGARYGYVVGAGIERQLTQRWSLTGEVMYYDLEDVSVEGTGGDLAPGFQGNNIKYEFDNDGWIARVGINLSF